MIFYKNNDTAISYTDTQTDGETLLFIHGTMMSKEVWQKQVEFFSNSYRVITIDLYGFGQSKGGFRDSSFEDHAEDIKDLLKYLSIKKVNLVGWSIGASIAVVFAEKYSDYLSKLILVDGTPKAIASEDFECAIPPEAAQQLGETLRNDFSAGVSVFVDMMLPETGVNNIKDMLLDICNQTDPKVALSQLSSSGQRDLRLKLPRIKSQTLVVCGELDAFCPPKASEYFANLIPNALLHIFSGKGHAPFLTDSDNFNSTLNKFLSQNKPK